MKKIFERLLSKVNGYENIKTPELEVAEFILQYDDLVIGRLRLHSGHWHFDYSDAFKNQDLIKPLVDFPDVNKSYVSETLWPFFMVRIPSLEQPAVKKILKTEDINGENEVELLKRFGKKSITNPFLLEPV